MNRSIDWQIEDFRKNFKDFIQYYKDLSLGTKYYLLKGEIKELELLYYSSLNSQILKEEKEKSSSMSQDEAN